MMLADSERLITTIDQVLRTGRLGASRRKPDLAPIDLAVLLEECIARIRTLHDLPPDALSYQRSSDIAIQGDSEEVRAAVSNLLDNAVKYSSGNVKVTVETARVKGKYIALRVKDQGSGIPQSELKRIFKRFYRVPGPLATRLKGTGLGLYIVRSVAKRHGGRAWAESAGPGQGSTFTLQFPVSK
jgi:two-component system, OmpR family, sensor histidine kinase SenX3